MTTRGALEEQLEFTTFVLKVFTKKLSVFYISTTKSLRSRSIFGIRNGRTSSCGAKGNLRFPAHTGETAGEIHLQNVEVRDRNLQLAAKPLHILHCISEQQEVVLIEPESGRK